MRDRESVVQNNSDECSAYRAGYPLVLDIRNQNVVVIGAGAVAERKVRSLLDYGPCIHVVAPHATDQIKTWDREGDIVWSPRAYRNGDVADSILVFCACGVESVEKRVQAEAHHCHTLINVVDVPRACDFIVPSVVSRGPLRVAISTSGAAPAVARSIRCSIEDMFDASWEPYLELLGRVRLHAQKALKAYPDVRRAVLLASSKCGFRERIAAGEHISTEDAYATALDRARTCDRPLKVSSSEANIDVSCRSTSATMGCMR
jgi:precorrin-2 dehydrogenase/sirohydrochlorin ferrochelatase